MNNWEKRVFIAFVFSLCLVSLTIMELNNIYVTGTKEADPVEMSEFNSEGDDYAGAGPVALKETNGKTAPQTSAVEPADEPERQEESAELDPRLKEELDALITMLEDDINQNKLKLSLEEEAGGPEPGVQEAKYPKGLHTCANQNFGIEFSCDLNWEVEESAGGDFIILNKLPRVSMSLDEFKTDKKFIGQLTKEYISALGEYEDGFTRQYVDFAGRQALVFKGFTKNNIEERRQDYFYVYDNKIHRVSFSLYPRSQWDEGKDVIAEMVKNFVILK